MGWDIYIRVSETGKNEELIDFLIKHDNTIDLD